MAKRRRALSILALDIGTSSLRTALFDERIRRRRSSAAAREYAVRYSAQGGAELGARELLAAAKYCIAKTCRAVRPDAIAASAFWHSLLGLDRKRKPITPIFTWADSRGVDAAAKLRCELDEREVHARTGCMLRASFWPAKLRWLERSNPRLFRCVAFWVSPADWIFEQLFGVAGTSHSIASGTGVYNRLTRDWDKEICVACDISVDQLSRILDRTSDVFLPIGDGAASNLGSGANHLNSFAINIGTSAAVRCVIGAAKSVAVPFGLFRYALDQRRDVIGGAISNAGNLRCWCLRELRMTERKLRRVDRIAAAESELDVLPFWVAERAPTWPEHLSGMIAGLNASTTAVEIERAAICATFYRLAQILDGIEAAVVCAKKVIVSGGILRSPDLLPVLADALGRDIHISAEREASLRGAAVYALEQLGIEIPPLHPGKEIRHDRELAKKHRQRRGRQEGLEQQWL